MSANTTSQGETVAVRASRLAGFDVARAVALVLIIVGHVVSNRLAPAANGMAPVLDTVFKLLLGIFFAISGYLDHLSASRVTDARDRRLWLLRRVRRLLVAFAIASVAYLLVQLGQGSVPVLSVRNLGFYLFGGAEWHLWYLPALAMSVGLYWPARWAGLPAWAAFALACVMLVLADAVSLMGPLVLWQVANYSFIDWMAFYALGVLMAGWALPAHVRWRPWMPWALGASLTAFALVGVPNTTVHSQALPRIAWLVLSILIVTGIVLWASRPALRVPGAVSLFGRATLVPYLVHMLPIRLGLHAGLLEGASWWEICAQILVAVAATAVISLLLWRLGRSRLWRWIAQT